SYPLLRGEDRRSAHLDALTAAGPRTASSREGVPAPASVPDVCGVPAQFACVSPHVALGPGGVGSLSGHYVRSESPPLPAPREAVTNHARFTPEGGTARRRVFGARRRRHA